MVDINKLDFDKLNGIMPAIITDNETEKILMLGFMNRQALEKTIETGLVTFFSRTKNRLWTKGETSGNFLKLVSIKTDCDWDSLLIMAIPEGKTCHTGSYSCFGLEKEDNFPQKGHSDKQTKSNDFLDILFSLIKSRKAEMPENSYTTKLFQRGTNRIIQKVGEEAIETVIAAKNRDRNEIINEVSDLVYHLFVMLVEQNIEFSEIVDNLEQRHSK